MQTSQSQATEERRLLIPVLLLQVTQFLPAFGFPGLIDGLDRVVIGAVPLAPRCASQRFRIRFRVRRHSQQLGKPARFFAGCSIVSPTALLGA